MSLLSLTDSCKQRLKLTSKKSSSLMVDFTVKPDICAICVATYGLPVSARNLIVHLLELCLIVKKQSLLPVGMKKIDAEDFIVFMKL